MKRSLAVFLCVVLIFSLVSSFTGSVFAAETDISNIGAAISGPGTTSFDSHFSTYTYKNLYSYNNWTNFEVTNNISSSQTIKFSYADYSIGGDWAFVTTYGGLVQEPTDSAGNPKLPITLDAVRNNSYGIYKSSTSPIYVSVYKPGTQYGLFALSYSLMGTVTRVANFYVTRTPFRAYQTSLNANGGSCSLGSVMTVFVPYTTDGRTLLYKENVCNFPVPTREGYTCIGWSNNPNASSGVWSMIPSTNETYYAIWQKDPEPVTEPHTHTPADAVKENEKPATCTAEGSYDEVVYCSECGEELSRETKTTDKLDHTPAEAVKENEKPATCTAEGSYDEVVYCSECGEELSRETKTTDKLDHTPAEAVKENEKPATCTAEGSYDEVVYCSECGEELSRETKTTDKLDHTLEAVDKVEPTYTSEGRKFHYICTECGKLFWDATGTIEITDPAALIISALEPTEPVTEVQVPTEPLAVPEKTFAVTADKTDIEGGDEVTFTVTLGPENYINSYQFDIIIPKGLTYVEDSLSFDSSAVNSYFGFDESAALYIQSSNKIHSDAYGLQNTNTKEPYELCSFKLRADDSAVGVYEVKIDDNSFVAVCNVTYNIEDDVSKEYTLVPAKINVVGSESTEPTEPPTEKPEDPIYIGDANGDGDVDAIDATIVQRVATMVKVPFDRDQMMRADVDDDGELTVLDATYILRHSTHVKTPYPVGDIKQ